MAEHYPHEAQVGEEWRHLKRGSEYSIVGIVPAGFRCAEPGVIQVVGINYRLQTSTRPIEVGDTLVLYKDLKGEGRWARLMEEFVDGRFECVREKGEHQDGSTR